MGSQGMKDFEITGIVAAPFTPFDDNGELALDKIDPYIDHLLATGVSCVYILGTTGEGPSLTIDERKRVAEKWVKSANGRFRTILVQVGSGNLKEVEELARHAEAIGVDAISTIPTIFFKPSGPEVIADFLQRVSAAAPSLPLYYYHNPSMTGVSFPMESILKECSNDNTLRGVKFTSMDLFDLGRCISLKEHFQFLYGVEEQFLSALALGVKGAIGSTYNYLGNVANRLLRAFNKGDLEAARKEQNHINEVVSILKKYGGNTAINKCIANLSGLDLGPSRHPLCDLSETKVNEMKADLKSVDFFEFIK